MSGDLIPGSGGLRKLRVGRSGSGKRGGARVIYYFYNEDIPLLLMAILREEREGRFERTGQEEIHGIRKGVPGAMAKKVKRTKPKPSLADDLRASWEEALRYARGEKTGAIVHTVIPSDTDAREARHKLGLSQSEFAQLIGTGVGTVRKWELGTRRPSGAARTLIEVIKAEPKAVRRALAKSA
jgi:putative transcriptional regulator